MISIALYQPEIPQNTGNIARLAVGLDIDLYLIGFQDYIRCIERILLHFDKSKRLSGGGAAAMPHLAVYKNWR